MAKPNIPFLQQHIVCCPSCNNGVHYYDIRKSSHFACPNCAAYFLVNMGVPSIIKTFDNDFKEPFTLPLGLQTVMYDKEYIIAGHIYKKQNNAEVYWNEYLLYTAADDDYLILSEFDGHWLLLYKTDTKHPDNRDTITYKNKKFNRDLYYKADVVYATGEFDWNILNDERLSATEYVHPPYMLLREKGTLQTDWYEGVYLSTRELLRWFDDMKAEQLAPRSGRVNFNPATFYPAYRPMMVFTGLVLAAFTIFHLFLSNIKPDRTLYEDLVICEADTASWSSGGAKAIITKPFAVTGPVPLKIEFYATTLDNDWLELQCELINDNTGAIYEVDKTLESYSGVEDGEHWSEGDQRSNALIQGVPSGTYHLNVYPFSGQKATVMPSFAIKVIQESYVGSNFWIMLLVVITYPVIQFIRKWKFERSRWFAAGDYTTNND